MHIDRSTKFTNDFFGIVEDRLSIEWDSQNNPIFIPSRISRLCIKDLRQDIIDLYNSTSLSNAITDMETCPRDHKIIQSTGIGLAPDFDRFTRLGLLLGDRLVLWDTVIQSMLFNSSNIINIVSLGRVVCNLLLLKPIVQLGGVVFLPHPTTWLDRAKYYFERVAHIRGLSTEFLGYLNARSLFDQGISIHPYSLTPNKKHSKQLRDNLIQNHDLLQEKAVGYHNQLNDFLEDESFLFLNEISLKSFYEQLGKRDYRQDLRNLLSAAPDSGLSEPDLSQFNERIRENMRKSIDTQNKDLAQKKLAITGASLGAASATIALLSDAASSFAFFTLLAGGMATISEWMPIFTKLFTKSDKPTIYQVFHDLEEENEREVVISEIKKFEIYNELRYKV